MFTQRVFDREEQARYEIQLEVHDHGHFSLSSTYHFSLIILDQNDHAPQFDRDIYVLDISETTPVDSILMQFHAVDADEQNTKNSRVDYRLSDSNVFTLDTTTGDLRLMAKLDREKQAIYELEITAADHGQPRSLYSSARCRIHVVDSNDNLPVFDSSVYVFDIDETWPSHAPIGSVHARDADEDFNQLSYRFDYDPTTASDEWPFEVTSNGTLYLRTTYVGE